MAYCGWPTTVNKLILSSTNVTVGEKATVKDSLESGGLEKSRLSCSHPSDKFSVVMEFDFSKQLSNGYTEVDNFWAWYKTVHKYGTVPFQFPAILINSNRIAGLSVEERGYAVESGLSIDDVTDKEYYKITSAVEGSTNGTSQQIKMTWETYATGVIQEESDDSNFEVNRLEAENGKVYVIMNAKPSYEPNSATWDVKYSKNGGAETALTIANCMYDGGRTATLYYEEFTDPGSYEILIDDKTDMFVVA